MARRENVPPEPEPRWSWDPKPTEPFSPRAHELKQDVERGSMTRQEAVDKLTSEYQLTERGAEETLDAS